MLRKLQNVGEMPGFIEPELATLVDEAPHTDRYVHELKYDGYRLQAHKRDGEISLWTRSGLNWTHRFPSIAKGLKNLKASEAILDGEVISADEKGRANFSQLQADLSNSRYGRMVYFCFDLMWVDGQDIRSAPLIERKARLEKLLKRMKHPIHYSQHFEGDGTPLFDEVCKEKMEGIISKLKTSTYRSDRTKDWLKIKCIQTARYEVIGYKNGATSLYLAKRVGKDLVYVGKAGTGFTNAMIVKLGDLLKPTRLDNMPLAKKPDRKNKIDNWAAPKYWAEVGFRDITSDGLLRHVTFKGLYPSKKSKSPLVGG
jgi:bifunctional non-homologous end joining protein LigD